MSIGAGVFLLVFAVVFALLVNSAKRRRGPGVHTRADGGSGDSGSGWLADSSHGHHPHHSGSGDGGHHGGGFDGGSGGSDGGGGGGGDGGGGGH